MIEYGKNHIGKDPLIFTNVTLGFPSRENLGKDEFKGTIIGDNAVIRSGTILYCDVTAGNNLSTGHNVMVREHTKIGDRVSLGTGVIIEGKCVIGNDVNLQSLVYIPTDTKIGNNVFIGPNTVLTNDTYPPCGKQLFGPVIEDNASIGANATILPGVRIGTGSLVAAGAVVTKDVPANQLAVGAPARFKEMPDGAKR